MTILEQNSRFPAEADIDAAWRSGIEALMAATRVSPWGADGGGATESCETALLTADA